ncbi:hypothetical protein CSKR_113973 [Clonorchis sinensis]|uniref:Uncharacterized protein n=1 Tax=Clonorchis sinensis TaxID=79923 RepID=A0A419PVQ4_CLOSI|nr:hypothetical protein CSKR_113973 [Clonorchis sinensis]
MVRGSNPISASRLPLSRLEQPGSIPALVFGWQLSTERVLQLDSYQWARLPTCEPEVVRHYLRYGTSGLETLEQNAENLTILQRSPRLFNCLVTDTPAPTHTSYGSETTIVEHLKTSQFRCSNRPSPTAIQQNSPHCSLIHTSLEIQGYTSLTP